MTIDDMIDALATITAWHMEWHRLREDALALPPDQCKEFLLGKFPTIQGTGHRIRLERLAATPHNDKKFGYVVEILTKAQGNHE